MRVHTVLALGLLLALAAAPASVRAEQADMFKLPAYTANNPSVSDGCLNCHNNTESEIGLNALLAKQLNVFGEAWLSNGRVWDKELAQRDTDGDGCLNGFELGDVTGRWIAPSPPAEHAGDLQEGNPANVDCKLASIDERSWGILKAVFGEANKLRVR